MNSVINTKKRFHYVHSYLAVMENVDMVVFVDEMSYIINTLCTKG